MVSKCKMHPNVPAFASSYLYSYFFLGRFLLFELNFYFSPTFFYRFLLVLLFTCPTDWTPLTLAYWVVQQHKRFISTNTCSSICIWRIVLLIIITIFFSPMNSREVGYLDA